MLDLHRHLEGSHSATALLSVARALDIRREPFFVNGAFLTPQDLAPALHMLEPSEDGAVFYACIERARRAYVSVEAVELLSHHAFMEAAAETDGLEMRVSLFSMTRTLLEQQWPNVTPQVFSRHAEQALDAVLRARDQAQQASGKTLLVRVGFSRTFTSAVAPHHHAMADVIRGRARQLSGLDVLGILPAAADKEALQPALMEVVQSLRDVLPDLTLHAGEFENHQSVERALQFEPRGVGHGVHAVASAPVMERLAQRGVTLEVCPTSNALLIPSALARLRHAHGGLHPLRVFQNAGVRAVLGSDDPVPMHTTFARELQRARDEGVHMDRLHQDAARRWHQLTGQHWFPRALPD